jgi:hypothetical protein
MVEMERLAEMEQQEHEVNQVCGGNQESQEYMAGMAKMGTWGRGSGTTRQSDNNVWLARKNFHGQRLILWTVAHDS